MANPAPLGLQLKPREVIGSRYRVLRKLGEGGCGSVYRCEVVDKPGAEVAVKVLENRSDKDRFLRERKLLKEIDSRHVVDFIDQGTHESFPYLVLEFMAGGSLRDLLDKRKALPPAEAAWVLIMAIRGLRKAATVHRDLKPENLLLTKGPDGRITLVPGEVRKASVIKVADFGLAKSWDPKTMALTNTGHIMGTPLYMSPEQCRCTRDVGVTSDIYSMGVILYEMVLGQPPFDADNPYDLMTMQCNDTPAFPQRIDRQVEAVVRKCLQKKPELRYQTLKGLEGDLAVIAGIGRPADDGGGDEAAGGDGSRRWLLVGAAFLLFVTVAYLTRDPVLSLLRSWWDGPAPEAPRPVSRPALGH
ncbi:MAG: serine/threonine protein kinase [Planctomycetes bacterium]|nr:serine/threonine protein kinase [Planctomycetota bacterium]